MPVRFHLNGRPFLARAFLFDKDGTLITFDHWFLVMAERARRLARALGLTSAQAETLAKFMGVKPERPGDWGIIPLPRGEAEEATAQYLSQKLNVPVFEVLPLVKKVFAEVDEDFPFEKHLAPTPGAGEVLQRIKRAGGKIGVVTHDSSAPARLHLRALGWEELIDAVVGLDLCPVKKPAPDPVLRACGLLGLSPAEAVMVGDTASDLQAGRAAGCLAAFGVLTGLGTPEELRPHADAVLKNLAELEFSE
ncbi:HAD family hydrolase [Candidatus Bipolaricaulota bacterium]|nr:HAD family hydrolase [Candidatus Bipolaricaulota bacterium]